MDGKYFAPQVTRPILGRCRQMQPELLWKWGTARQNFSLTIASLTGTITRRNGSRYRRGALPCLLVLQPFTNARNSTHLDSCRIGRILPTLSKSEEFHRIRGGIPPILRARGKCTTECSGACTSRFALLLQYQDITSRPVEHTRSNSPTKRRRLNQPAAASSPGKDPRVLL